MTLLDVLDDKIKKTVHPYIASQSLEFSNTDELLKFLRLVRDRIRLCVDDVFSTTIPKPSETAASWLTSWVFTHTKINGHAVEQMIVSNGYKTSELSYADLRLLKSMFPNSAISTEVSEELSRRPRPASD